MEKAIEEFKKAWDKFVEALKNLVEKIVARVKPTIDKYKVETIEDDHPKTILDDDYGIEEQAEKITDSVVRNIVLNWKRAKPEDFTSEEFKKSIKKSVTEVL